MSVLKLYNEDQYSGFEMVLNVFLNFINPSITAFKYKTLTTPQVSLKLNFFNNLKRSSLDKINHYWTPLLGWQSTNKLFFLARRSIFGVGRY